MEAFKGRRVQPRLERLESRELLSLPYLVLALQQQAMNNDAKRKLANLTLASPAAPSAPQNGSGVFNPLLTPTGVPTKSESRREMYHATYVGQYTIGPGRFSTEAANFYLTGTGRSNQVAHSDMQMRVIRPTNPSMPSTGEVTFFDRNIDSNSDLGFDIYARPQKLDALGRPTQLVIYALDANVSGGNYVEGIANGTISVRYGPTPSTPHFNSSTRPLPGSLSQGTASVVINAQVYGIGTTFALHNVNINP
jgi:hypothetical protein